MEHGPCELVVEHNKVLGGIQTDINYIKEKLDNGLTDLVAEIKAKVDATAVAEQLREERRKKRNDHWVTAIFEGSVKKFLGIVFLFILLTAGMNTGMWAYFKTYGFQEKPGQQAAIYSISSNGTYHLHTLPDGKIIFHGNAQDKPAWVLDPITSRWQRCPQFRTDEAIGVSVK